MAGRQISRKINHSARHFKISLLRSHLALWILNSRMVHLLHKCLHDLPQDGKLAKGNLRLIQLTVIRLAIDDSIDKSRYALLRIVLKAP